MALSGDQLSAVQSTWSTVESDLGGHGVAFFKEAFTKDENIRQAFPKLKDIPIGDLGNEAVATNHFNAVMNELSKTIKSAGDAGALGATLSDHAARHTNRNVSAKMYEDLFVILHDYLKSQLGDSFSADASAGYNKFFEIFVSGVKG